MSSGISNGFIKSPKLKALLFDVDGTMADTDIFHRQVFKEILKPFGIDCDDRYYNEHVSGKANRQLHQQLVPHMSKEEAEQFFIDKETKFRELSRAHLRPLEGLIHLIKTVKLHGIKVGAVTNAPRPNVEMMLELFGFASDEHPISPHGSSGFSTSLDTIVMGDDCRESKPSPEPYQIAMQRLDVQPKECIVFEDSSSGVIAGVRAGCQTIGVLTTKNEEQMMKLGCTGVIHDYQEIDIDKMIHEMKDYIKHKDDHDFRA